MATDPALPGLCRTAASKVDGVASEVASMIVGLRVSGIGAAWRGEASERYHQTMQRSATRLTRTMGNLGDLADLLRQSASEADARLRAEAAAKRKAAEAKAKEEAERRARGG